MNVVYLVGRAGDAPKNFAKTGENAVVGVSIATNEFYKDKQGNSVERTTWHNLIIFGSRGEQALKFINKGDKFAISGKIEYKKYLKSDGSQGVNTQIIVDTLELFNFKS